MITPVVPPSYCLFSVHFRGAYTEPWSPAIFVAGLLVDPVPNTLLAPLRLMLYA